MKFLLVKILFLLSLSSGAIAASENDLRAIWLNRTGEALLREQNFAEAFQSFAQALEYSPFAPELHLNMGLALEGQGQGDRALKAYLSALGYAKEPSIRFESLFNAAQLYGKAKRYQEALNYYQQALEIVPNSQEVKINIELLIQDQQQQQQQQGGEGQDKKDQSGGQGDKQDDKDQNGDKQDKPKDGPKKYADNPKPQPKPFKGENLSEGDVKKILGELKNQEQRIRREYYKKDLKDKGRDKDW